MAKAYAQFILRHKWMVIVVALLAIAGMGAGVRHLTFINDYRVFFGEENPQLLAFENLQDTYAKNDNAMFILVPADGQVFTRETLGAVAWLTERAWETPYSTRVESLCAISRAERFYYCSMQYRRSPLEHAGVMFSVQVTVVDATAPHNAKPAEALVKAAQSSVR